MKLYESDWAPNPRRVRIFLSEKDIEIDRVNVDLKSGEHLSADFFRINPLHRVPVLELDDGTMISESVAICRYFEEIKPEPPLFGRSPKEKAVIEMWNRRVEMGFFQSVAAAFRHIHPGMANAEKPQVREWGEVNKPKAIEFLQFLDAELTDRTFIAGEHYSIADITMLVAFDFMKVARLGCPEECQHVLRWHKTVSERPSASAQ
jgi:glutathione S-transferase